MNQGATLVSQFDASAREAADRLAIVDSYGHSLTYAQLEDQASRVAAFLQAAGVVKGDRVGAVLRKSTSAVSVLIGIMKAGAAYVPADYASPAERNLKILTDGGVRLAFLDESCEALAHAGAGTIQSIVVPLPGAEPSLVLPNALSWAQVLSVTSPARPVALTADDTAYILYTSGSTGVPKGVVLSHENAVSFVDWCSSVFTPTEYDRFSSHAPFHFDLSVLDLYVSLKHGATLYLVGEELGKSPRELAQFIATHKLSVWYSTPSILALLAQFGNLQAFDFSSLRLVLFAGEVFPVKHLRAIKQAWPDPVYYNLYGPTETNVCTFALIPTVVPADRDEPYPIGHTCGHCRSLILDDEREVEAGEEGLLYIGGPAVFSGYRNRPVENAAAFIERDGESWYNTGDVVREIPDEGFLYLGRRDRMVKRRGYRVELGEIESALYRHELIAEAAVIAVADDASGVRVVATLVAKGATRPTIIDLKAFCARKLPASMSPDAFVFLAALPRTSTNKVDYQQLKAMATEPRR